MPEFVLPGSTNAMGRGQGVKAGVAEGQHPRIFAFPVPSPASTPNRVSEPGELIIPESGTPAGCQPDILVTDTAPFKVFGTPLPVLNLLKTTKSCLPPKVKSGLKRNSEQRNHLQCVSA